MNVHQAENRIRQAAERLGYSVRASYARESRSRYLTIEDDDLNEVVVRISDHGEAYEPPRGERRICVDPQALTPAAAIAKLQSGLATIPPYEPDTTSSPEARARAEWERKCHAQYMDRILRGEPRDRDSKAWRQWHRHFRSIAGRNMYRRWKKGELGRQAESAARLK